MGGKPRTPAIPESGLAVGGGVLATFSHHSKNN